MKKNRSQKYSTKTKAALFTGTAALLTLANHAQASDPLIDKLEQKGVLTAAEAKDLRAESDAEQTNLVNSIPASKWKIADSIKDIQLYGDVRLRYEYRGVDNIPPDATGSTYYRERFRYAIRIGVKGDLYDNFNYGLRLETSTNPRSPWATFGSQGTAGSATPSDKFGSGIGFGQYYLGWKPTDWYEMTVGRMPMMLYTTPMVWDSDINPEGAFEKFKVSVGNVDLFADFAQIDYSDPNPASDLPSSDTFVLAWQVGGVVKLPKNMSFKIAPTLYNYTGVTTASGSGLNQPFVGQAPTSGKNLGVPSTTSSTYLNPGPTDYNSDGIDNLLVFEVPFEFDFKIPHTALGALQARFFGDFAYNIDGNQRADASFNANPGAFTPYGVNSPARGQNIAYQLGFGIGSDGPEYGPTKGLVYGSTSKKGTWEARAYWQHIEQDSLDVNLIDSDFFEGRANLEGFYLAFAYSFTDAIIGTVRYGHASRIDDQLGTGGNNLDIPGINPINNYNLVQMDLTWRF